MDRAGDGMADARGSILRLAPRSPPSWPLTERDVDDGDPPRTGDVVGSWDTLAPIVD